MVPAAVVTAGSGVKAAVITADVELALVAAGVKAAVVVACVGGVEAAEIATARVEAALVAGVDGCLDGRPRTTRSLALHI